MCGQDEIRVMCVYGVNISEEQVWSVSAYALSVFIVISHGPVITSAVPYSSSFFLVLAYLVFLLFF